MNAINFITPEDRAIIDKKLIQSAHMLLSLTKTNYCESNDIDFVTALGATVERLNSIIKPFDKAKEFIKIPLPELGLYEFKSKTPIVNKEDFDERIKSEAIFQLLTRFHKI